MNHDHTLTLDELNDLMLSIDIEIDPDYGDDHVRTDYSGRSMFGERCIGIVCQNPTAVMFRLGIEVGKRIEAESGDAGAHRWFDLSGAFEDARTDSMGRYSEIVYFPRLQLAPVPVG